MGLNIRRIKIQDRDQVLKLAKAMHDESPRYKHIPFSEDKASELILQMTTSWVLSPLQSVGFIAEQDGRVIGMVGGAVATHFFSDTKYLTDFVVYVSPEQRGGSSAIRLIKKFENWASHNGVPEVVLGVSTEVNPEQTVRMYKKLGYRLYSYSMVKEV